jgi:hypothetical protein
MIYEIGDYPIRPAVVADSLDLDEQLLTRILRLYAKEQVVRETDRHFCSECDSLISDQDQSCDNCETIFKLLQPAMTKVFVIVEPILRQGFADVVETPADIVVQFVAGDRGGSQANQLKIPDEMKILQDSLKAGVNAGFFKHPQPILGATAHDLGKAYLNRPAVLHVAGHGNDRSLSLIAHQGSMVTTRQLTGHELVKILTSYPSRLQLCVLNACDSREIAELLAGSGAVDVAIGWSGQPSDVSAITFVKYFYEHLSHGLIVWQAFNLAQATLGIVSAGVSPFLFARTGVDLATFRLPRGSEA